MDNHIERLTPQEEAVMQVFWTHQAHLVKEVVSLLPEPKMPYTTVASIVRNLEAKGYLRGEHHGRRYEYEILIGANEYSEGNLGRLVGQFFTGSYKNLVQNFVSSNKISADELRDIIRMIEQGEQ